MIRTRQRGSTTGLAPCLSWALGHSLSGGRTAAQACLIWLSAKNAAAQYTVISQLIASAERVGPRQFRWLFGMEKERAFKAMGQRQHSNPEVIGEELDNSTLKLNSQDPSLKSRQGNVC